MPERLVVKIAAGAAEQERTLTGLSVAAAASASGVPVSLWLSGDASWLAVAEPPAGLSGDQEAAELLAELRASARVAVCARCAQRRGIGGDDLLPGARIAGAAAFVAEVMAPQTQALVY